MQRSDARRLLGHGALVVLIGMLVGFPYATTVVDGGEVRAWRMAHLEGVLNGLLMMAVAAGGSLLRLSPRGSSLLRWTLVITGYANVLASTLGAVTGHRGLQAGGPAANVAVFVGFMLAVFAVLAALLLVVWSAFGSEERS